jgi:cellulose synthase/poly-beta-1,6-N-acetylglucosamine synthase-like glycosyltransferase
MPNFYSIVVAAYLRSDEIEEFLKSMISQKYKDFEIIISDGSPDDRLREVILKYTTYYKLRHIYEKNLKASESRNLGCQHAEGDYFIFLDSDCIIPEDYLLKVDEFLSKNPVDAFGGPDKAHESFTPTMKAINYAMTSFLTTGGIRGKKKSVGKFNLRGFNMGISRKVFQTTGGFSTMQVAEDIELSARIDKAGFKKALIPDAYVYHKRKSNFKKFWKQLKMHGKGRIDLYMRHKEELKPVHFLPTMFVLFLFSSLLIALACWAWGKFLLLLLGTYVLALLIDSSIQNKSLYIGILGTWASLIMLTSYGIGLLQNMWKRLILKQNKEIDKDLILKQ